MLNMKTNREALTTDQQIPAKFVDAVKDLPIDVLTGIEREISYFEATGILKGRALQIMKSLETQKPQRRSVRPTLLVA